MNKETTASKAGKEPARRLHPDQLPFLPATIAGMLKALHKSCNFSILGREHEAEAFSHGGVVLHACWHFAFPAVIYHFKDRNGMLMVSRSRDGELIARILDRLGYTCARGSPGVGKGGSAALKRMLSHLKKGGSAGLIADGSQGPPLVAQKGVILLARFAGAPLLPVSMAANPCWKFPSWDRTVLAKPFSRVALAFGPALQIKRDAEEDELEAQRLLLEERINELTRKCELAVGINPGS